MYLVFKIHIVFKVYLAFKMYFVFKIYLVCKIHLVFKMYPAALKATCSMFYFTAFTATLRRKGILLRTAERAFNLTFGTGGCKKTAPQQ